MPAHTLAQRMAVRLSELENHALMRRPCLVQGVNLCSNDYLGLAADPRLRAALIEGIDECQRTGSTGSRLLSGHHASWDRLEQEFAAFAGTEASLFFNSGFAANTGLFPALLGPADVVFSDSLNHASLIDGIRLSRARKVIYPHCDLNSLQDALRQHSSPAGAQVIVTESIFSMDGDRAPLAGIFQLAAQYGADVIMDEAHATGACGPGGRGLVVDHGLEKQALAIIHTCGKALASAGAFVCGSMVLRQTLINHARSFIFSTALPPYFAFQISAALRLAGSMDLERAQLAVLSANLRERLTGVGIDCGASSSHIVPWIVGGSEAALRLASALQQRGFGVRALRSPSVPAGMERLRISLTASLAKTDLDRFADEAASLSSLDVAHD
jgi:8-amino-7-oxononanoate synthase